MSKPVEPVTPVEPVVAPVVETVAPIAPVTQTPPVAPVAPVPDPNIAKLEKELAEAKAALAAKADTETALLGVKTQLDSLNTEISKLTEYEQTVKDMVASKIASIPENLRGLVPTGTAKEQLDWISKAETSGLFKSTVTEIGKPFNPKSAPTVDINSLSPSAILSMAYAVKH